MFRTAHRSSSGTLNCVCNFWFIYPCGDRPLPMLSGKCMYFYWIIHDARIHEYQTHFFVIIESVASTVDGGNCYWRGSGCGKNTCRSTVANRIWLPHDWKASCIQNGASISSSFFLLFPLPYPASRVRRPLGQKTTTWDATRRDQDRRWMNRRQSLVRETLLRMGSE
jgi:hypothetical protein